ncbi:alpha/beta hydrolase family protein [Paraglaciecola sp. 2405UD69-4]|uniref:alpha/beta hydrolase family protein n=1 Tax=Paraglaciecola sp. 2405UD69-4 TaxID=3391836 RepID=UPI0039C8CF4E
MLNNPLKLFVFFVLFSSISVNVFANSSTAALLKPPLASFSQLPSFQNVRLSPSGNRIVYTQNVPSPKNVASLNFYDLSTGKMTPILSSDNKKISIRWYRWATEDILLLSISDEQESEGTKYIDTRLYSIDLSKNKFELKLLVKPAYSTRNDIRNYWDPQFKDKVVDFLPEDPDHILMAIDFDIPHQPAVYKVNIHSAKNQRILRSKLNVRHWITDRQNVVRIAAGQNYDNGEFRYSYAKEKGASFKTLFKYNALTDKPIEVLGFDLDPNILFYTQYKLDKKALYKMDLTTQESSLLLAHENYDVDGELIYSKTSGEAIGLTDAHSPYGRFYFNDKHYQLHRQLDKAIPNASNFIHSQNKDGTRYILRSESDTSPSFYYLGDKTEGSLSGLLNSYPSLEGVQLPRHKTITFTTRDNLKIEALLTLPLFGEAPYPTVVHPHGGPGARDYSGFDPYVSFMNSRGYAVIRPNFRGSTGYGHEFAEAQKGRWGLEMQDDIVDATQHLIEQGIAQKDKICIFGASYGGYAAMMATVKTPDLYACAVSFAGVSDLKALRRSTREYFAGSLFIDAQLGKRSSDLASRSPINFVEKIKTPLLIMHGVEDRSVPVEQSRAFVKELKNQGKVFKYVESRLGGHHLKLSEQRHELFVELEKFLSEHLGEITP